MSLEALILSKDQEVTLAFRRVLQANSISLVVAASVKEANENLGNRKYDAVIIDCDDIAGASSVLEVLRKGQSNRSAIAFAITNGVTTMKKAYDLGANFVLEKPLSADRISRSVRAGRGLILRERRKYFRYPVGTDAALTIGADKKVQARIVNLSEGGLAVQMDVVGTPTSAMRIKFLLPESAVRIEGKCEVQWVNAGQVGLRFTQLEPDSRQELTRWLTRKIESKEIPSRATSTPG